VWNPFARGRSSLAETALKTIAATWRVDRDRIRWGEAGFDWCPGRFRVAVRAEDSRKDRADPACRVSVRTDFLQNVAIERPEVVRRLLLLSATAPSYAWVFVPPEVGKRYPKQVDRKVYLNATAYFRPDNIESWTPLFARLALLQATDAERLADSAARELQADLDTSRPSASASPDHRDDMLKVAGELHAPLGREPSRWRGSDEFTAFAERFGRSDLSFGIADADGLHLETPVGAEAAMIRLQTDQPHPALGSGLLATVQLPFLQDEETTCERCAWLNFFEYFGWSEVPQLGSWHPAETAAGLFETRSAFFIPNALHKPGLAANAALWQFGRVRWAKGQLWPDLRDSTMAEILRKRLGA
jgi:hypothetical protein